MTVLKRYENGPDQVSASEELADRARKHSLENKCDYSTSIQAVLAENKDLGVRYVKESEQTKAPEKVTYSDPYAFSSDDTPRQQRVKAYKQADHKVSFMIESMMLTQNLSRADSTRLVFQNPENRELVDVYVNGPE